MPNTNEELAITLTRAVDVITSLTDQIALLRPAAEFGQAVMDDGKNYGFALAAKMLSPKLKEETGHDIGRDRLIDALRALHIINYDRIPYQQYAHYFKVVNKETAIGMQPTSLLTGKGLSWVLPKLIEYYR